MAVEAVRFTLHQGGAAPCTGACDGLASDTIDLQHIHAVHCLARNVIGHGAHSDVFDFLVDALWRRFRILIVLADKDHWQIPYRGEIESLVKGSRVSPTIAEKTHGDLIGAPHLEGEGRARGDRDARADDAIGPQDAQLQVGDMHRPALPLAVARLLAVELRHHAVEAGALGDDIAMAAMRAGDIIVGAEMGAHPRRHRLLADRDMQKTGEPPLLKQLHDPLLERPDADHRLIQFVQRFFVDVQHGYLSLTMLPYTSQLSAWMATNIPEGLADSTIKPGVNLPYSPQKRWLRDLRWLFRPALAGPNRLSAFVLCP